MSANSWDSHLRIFQNIFQVHLSYTELTEKMMREREQATNTKADIHEQDEAYLRACRENAKKVAERCSWQRIGCSKDGAMRTVEDIHEEIYHRVTELLKA